jgi:hypothetical protein
MVTFGLVCVFSVATYEMNQPQLCGEIKVELGWSGIRVLPSVASAFLSSCYSCISYSAGQKKVDRVVATTSFCSAKWLAIHCRT